MNRTNALFAFAGLALALSAKYLLPPPKHNLASQSLPTTLSSHVSAATFSRR